jgi:hypothetical protein
MKLKEIEQYWSMIESSLDNSNSFLRSNWFDAWTIYINDENSWQGNIQYEYVSCKNGCVLLPLAKQVVGPLSFTSLAGNFFPHRAFPFTGEPESAAVAVADKISTVNVGSGFRAGPILFDEPFNEALLSELQKRHWKISINELGYSHRLVLPDEKDQYLDTLTTKRKKKLRYYWNSINKQGDTSIVHTTGLSGTEWTKVFTDLAMIESDAWVSNKGEPRFIGESNIAFWNSLANDVWYQNALNVWTLYLDGIPVSYTIALDAGDTRHILANSYSESVAQFSTGSKLYTEMIFQAIESKVNFIDFGMGDSGYKGKWGAEPYRKIVDIYAFPRNLKGISAYCAFYMKKEFAKLKNYIQK